MSVADLQLVDVLKRMLKFQYEDHGYGRLSCRSCGAAGEQSFDDDGTDCSRYEPCSKSCPFQWAKDLIAHAVILIVVFVLMGASSASAQSLRVADTVFLSGALADNVSTIYALKAKNYLGNTGVSEQNPFVNWMQEKPIAMMAMATTADLGSCWALNRLGRTHRKVATVALLAASVIRFGLAARGIRNGWHQAHSW